MGILQDLTHIFYSKQGIDLIEKRLLCFTYHVLPHTKPHNCFHCLIALPMETRPLQIHSLLATMPIATFLELSPTDSMAKHGTLLASRLPTTTLVTHFSTASRGILPQDNSALLAKLQGLPIHTPPSPRPIHAGACPLTKTKLHAKHKAKKEVKAKAVKDRKLAVAAKCAESPARKQEKQELQLSAAEAKASKAVVNAK
jgi:hypothetical protein